jgi:hypothetical protein
MTTPDALLILATLYHFGGDRWALAALVAAVLFAFAGQ